MKEMYNIMQSIYYWPHMAAYYTQKLCFYKAFLDLRKKAITEQIQLFFVSGLLETIAMSIEHPWTAHASKVGRVLAKDSA